MLKLFIGTLSSLLLLVAGIVIFYWRDIQYDPTGADLLNYLLLFPLILCVILWSPIFIYHGIKVYQKRKEQQKQAQVEQDLDDENQQAEAVEVQWLNLNIYSSSAYIVKLLYYSYKIRKKLEITHRLSRSTILYAYV